jgi:hypothetical protein
MDPLMMFDCQPESHYPLVHPAAEFSHSVIHMSSRSFGTAPLVSVRNDIAANSCSQLASASSESVPPCATSS